MSEPAQTSLRNRMVELAAAHDVSQMAKVIERGPGQIAYALSDDSQPTVPRRDYDRAVVAGMGGSALPVEVLNDAFGERLTAPLIASRTYDLPAWVDDRTLVIASSLSGNTEETLSAIDGFPAGAPNVVVMTAGGKLAELAVDRGFPLIRVPTEREPEGFQPRCATGYIVTYLSRILAEVGLLREPGSLLEELVEFLGRQDIRPGAEAIAEWIGRRIPIVYTDAVYEQTIAKITKIKINENAKRPAFYNALPESNHNEMVGFTQPIGEFACLYLSDPSSHPRIHKRFGIMQSVFQDRGMNHVSFNHWKIPGANPLQKIFAGLTFGDWCAYTLALLDGIDPSPVDLVEDFKKELT